MLGRSQIGELALELEQAAQTDAPLERLHDALERLTPALNRLTGRLRGALSISQPAPPAPVAEPVDPAQANATLTQLTALLASNDTDANELFEGSRSLLTVALGEVAATLGQQIAEYDYPQALQTLQAVWKPD